MRFRLIYDGGLKSGATARAKDRWAIRNALHPALLELWQNHPVWQKVRQSSVIPLPEQGSYIVFETSPLQQPKPLPLHRAPSDIRAGHIDVCTPIRLADGNEYVPFVRQSLGLACSINVIFMRKEPPGAIFTNIGDLDNRIKLLFDALRMPKQPDEFEGGGPIESPLFCLLENDDRITSFSVETDRLFTNPGDSKHRVHLVIEVTLRVIDHYTFNTPLLTD